MASEQEITGKILQVDWNIVSEADSENTELYGLTQRQVMILLSQTGYLHWKTRWKDVPVGVDINAITAEIEYNLMTPYELDCEEIEACLASSATIADLQSQITANDGDISSLQSQITANDGDISSLQSQVNNNIIAIADHELRLDQAELSIVQHNLTLDDHEDRIDALEAASGGSGSGDFDVLEIEIKRHIGTVVALSDVTELIVDIPVASRVILEIAVISDRTIQDRLFMYANDDDTLANYQSYRGETSDINLPLVGAIPEIDAYANLQWSRITTELFFTGTSNKHMARSYFAVSNNQASSSGDIGLYGWFHESIEPIESVRFVPENGGNLKAGSSVAVYVLEQREILVPAPLDNPILVDFDDGYEEWTSSNVSVDTGIGTGGNPDNCFIGTTNAADSSSYMSIKVDLGAVRTLDAIRCDFWKDSGSLNFGLYIDDVLIGNTSIHFDTFSVWHDTDGHIDFDLNDLHDGTETGQVIEIRMRDWTATIGNEMRIDNIEIAWS